MRPALLAVALTVALARLPMVFAVTAPGAVPGVSWPLIALGCLSVAVALAPFVRRFAATRAAPRVSGTFPFFGIVALGLVAISWASAWGVGPAVLRPYTFTPLWVGYIGVVLAWTQQRVGRSLLDAPRRLFGLTAVSAVFWWFFEYLNEFVGSWRYDGVEVTGPVTLVVFVVLPFATVLPAVVATRELLATVPRLEAAFISFVPVSSRHPRALGSAVAGLGLMGIALLGVFPHLLFPLVWLAPLLVLTGGQAALRLPHVFSGVKQGDWRAVVTWALGASICGFFWEGWNWLSLARWAYAIPYLAAPKLFEMPLLGYAGYLTFGWECAAVAALIASPRRVDSAQ